MNVLKIILAGTTTSIIFGLSFLFTKNAIDYVDPLQFLSFRFTISFVLLTVLVMAGIIKLKKKPYWKLWPVILFQPVLYFIFETFGVQRIASSEAGIIIATIPVVVSILAPFFLKEKPHFIQYMFIGMSLMGAVTIIGFNSGKSDILGDLLVFMAVLSAAGYQISSRKLNKEFLPQEITFFMMGTGAVFFTAMALINGKLNYANLVNPHVLPSALYLGILSSTLTFFLTNYMLSKVSPVQSSIFANLTTVISVIAGVIFRKESLYLQHYIGMILIIGGVWGVNYFGFKYAKANKSMK